MIEFTQEDIFRMGIICGQIEMNKCDEPIQFHRFLTETDEKFDNLTALYEGYCLFPKYSELSDFEIDFLGRFEIGNYSPNEELSPKEVIDNSKINFCTFKVGALLQFMKDNGVAINFISSKNERYYEAYNKFKTYLNINKQYLELIRNLVHKKTVPNTHTVVSST